MTPDQLLLDETHTWLDRARRDLRAAELLIAGERTPRLSSIASKRLKRQ